MKTTPVRLYLLQLEAMCVATPRGPLEMVLGCYLITTGDGSNIVIDSGEPPGYRRSGVPAAEDARTVIERLDQLGLGPDDIHMVICTHFDVDHAGHHDAFPRAEFMVQRVHYETALSGYPRCEPARPHWDHPGLRYRLVEGDTELLPGLSLLETGGHAVGHQSVLVRLPRTGPVLLTIDAVPLQRLFTPDRAPWPMDDDEEHTRASTRKLLEIVEREGGKLVIFGHDGAQWQELRTSPGWYE